ncbi:TIGR02677 family protein [Amycolatopsis sp. TRM77291]
MRRDSGDRQSLFAYVTADEAPEYRAIVSVLFIAAAEYRSDLTLADVDQALRGAESPLVLSREVLTRRLTQLCKWGNVDPVRDESWAHDLRSYELRADVYNLSAGGEAAHQAVVALEETLLKTIGLQRVALLRVHAIIEQFVAEALKDAPDGDMVYNLAEELHGAFKALAGNAGRFLQRVNQILNAPAVQVEDFLLFKVDTIHYLAEFTDHLDDVSEAVAPLFASLESEAARYSAALQAGAKASGEQFIDQADRLESWAVRTATRMDGIRRWFVPAGEGLAAGQQLHRMVRRAVLGIGAVLDRVRDARLMRTGSASDLLRLARGFSGSVTDEHAHALWHNELGLSSARHFSEDVVDDASPPSHDWWDAPVVRHTIKLRAVSSPDHVGRASRTPNHSATKHLLAEAVRQRIAEAENACATLVGLGRVRLSAVRRFPDHTTLTLLAGLVAQAQRATADLGSGERRATSVDGRLRITLLEPPTGQAARIDSPAGRWTLPDYEIHIVWTREL